jgi:hypothetical protein
MFALISAEGQGRVTLPFLFHGRLTPVRSRIESLIELPVTS